LISPTKEEMVRVLVVGSPVGKPLAEMLTFENLKIVDDWKLIFFLLGRDMILLFPKAIPVGVLKKKNYLNIHMRMVNNYIRMV
jgi:hypothetical protein